MDRLRRMEIFVSVVEAGQFTRAAQRLGLSKSTVSQAVSTLETYLGLQLFQRDSRSLQLTESGEIYYTESVRVLADINTLEDHIRDQNLGMSGLIRIAAPSFYGTMILQPLIVKFMEIYPDVSFDLLFSHTPTDLVARGVDIAFRLGKIKDCALLIRKVCSLGMVMCAAPEYLEKNGTPKNLADLENHNCLIFSQVPGWRFEKNGVGFILVVNGRVQSSDVNSYLDLIRAGVGIGFFAKFALVEEIDKGTIIPILENDTKMTYDVSIVRPANKHQPARIKTFTNFMIKNL